MSEFLPPRRGGRARNKEETLVRAITSWRGCVAVLFATLLTLTLGLGAIEPAMVAQAQERQVVLALAPDWTTFDPAHSYESTGQMVLRGIYEGLVRVDPVTRKIEPLLATKWTISNDGRTFTFSLNPNARFASGNPVTADDVVFSINRLKHMRGNPSFMATNIVSVEAVDPHTVVFTLAEPDSSFLTKLSVPAFGVTERAVVEAHGGVATEDAARVDTAQGWLDHHSAGSGPFVLAEYVPEERVVLVRNENYWGEPPQVDRVIISVVPDANMQALLLQNGDVDMALSLTADQLPLLSRARGVQVYTGETLTIFFLMMNDNPTIGGPMADERVRDAVRAAIDYEGFKLLFGVEATTPYSVIPVGMGGALPPEPPETNLDLARRLLAEAGYPNGFEIPLVVPNLTINGVSFLTTAEKVQADLARVGIRANIQLQEVSVFLPGYRDGTNAFTLSFWGPDYPDAINQLAFLPGGVMGLRAGWPREAQPELAALGEQIARTLDQDARDALLAEVQKALRSDGPFVVLFQPGRPVGYRSGIQFTYDPVTIVDLASLRR